MPRTQTPEYIRVERKLFIARTLAATASGMSYIYLTRLINKGLGPEGHVLRRDGKMFHAVTDVKRWAKARSWIKPIDQHIPRGRKKVTNLRRFEVNLPAEIVEKFRARYPNKYLSETIRELLTKHLETN